MSDAKRIKALVAVAALVVVAALVLRFAGTGSRTGAVNPSAAPRVESGRREALTSVGHTPRPTPEPSAEVESDGEEGRPTISREKVEEFLQLHNRSAASLLAGFHALNDTNLLNEAAAKFPNDPQVQWTMVVRNLNPEERRKWLDRFKASSPENSLANYLSAAEHFKSGQSDVAIKELLEAGGKPQFKGYAMTAMLDEQELSRFAGQTPLETLHATGWSGDLLGELPPMKIVANSIAEEQARYAQAGDAESAAALIQAGLGLSDRLTEGEGGRFVISQLVGMAVEAIMLRQLQADTKYDFLGGKTPTERQAELKQQKADFRALNAGLTSAYGSMSEADWLSYSDRMKTYGEVEAMKWLQQQVAKRTTPGN